MVGGGWLVRAVMNKDVLCVDLVVNHWQRWQLTDRQIDPRPPRERRLAPAHSSPPHECARTWRVHKDFQKARRRSQRLRSSSAVCGRRGNGRQQTKHLQLLHRCCSPVTCAYARSHTPAIRTSSCLRPETEEPREEWLDGQTDGWIAEEKTG